MSAERLFFYGTLRHLPLLEVVLGRAVGRGELTEAVLPGAEVAQVAGHDYPRIELGVGGAGAPGLVLVPASESDIARCDFYEGGFDYTLETVTLGDGRAAKVYLPGPDMGAPGGPFDIGAWAAQHGALALEAAREFMGYFGQISAEEAARRFPTIRLRADARLRARAVRHGEGTLQGRWEVLEHTTPYSDFFRMDDYTISVETFGGGMTGPMRRAVFVGMDAALVLPYDPVRNRVLVVEQFRMGPFGRGDPRPWQWEPIAGHIDPGERPEEAARREALEEAGLELGALEPVAEAYPAPGAVSEFYYLYIGIADLPDDVTGVAGMAEEGENIRSHLLSFDALMEMLEDRRSANLPLALAGYWLARHRERLRAG